MLSRESGAILLNAVTAFIYKEARFQDEHQYEAWEASHHLVGGAS